jgi:hypothetical protein
MRHNKNKMAAEVNSNRKENLQLRIRNILIVVLCFAAMRKYLITRKPIPGNGQWDSLFSWVVAYIVALISYQILSNP